jgi:Cu-processing system permease protein
MFKIFKYSLIDLLRSRWLIIYFLFFLAASFILFLFSTDTTKALISLLNVEISIIPLVSILFGIMYYYNSREFTELLLAQPLKRRSIFLGMYLSLASSLAVCFLLGTSIPFIVFNNGLGDVISFGYYLLTGSLLTFIFTAFAFLLGLLNDNRVKGFGLSILVWLYLVVIYDGIFLLILMNFQDYPLEKPTLVMTMLNPVDLSRVLVLLNLGISALMGYSGAVFNSFFGSAVGLLIAFLSLIIWVIFPIWLFLRIAALRNF